MVLRQTQLFSFVHQPLGIFDLFFGITIDLCWVDCSPRKTKSSRNSLSLSPFFSLRFSRGPPFHRVFDLRSTLDPVY